MSSPFAGGSYLFFSDKNLLSKWAETNFNLNTNSSLWAKDSVAWVNPFKYVGDQWISVSTIKELQVKQIGSYAFSHIDFEQTEDYEPLCFNESVERILQGAFYRAYFPSSVIILHSELQKIYSNAFSTIIFSNHYIQHIVFHFTIKNFFNISR